MRDSRARSAASRSVDLAALLRIVFVVGAGFLVWLAMSGAAGAQQADSGLRVEVRHTAVGSTELPSSWNVNVSSNCLSASLNAPAIVEPPATVASFEVPRRQNGLDCYYFATLGKNAGWLSSSLRGVAGPDDLDPIVFTVVPETSLHLDVRVECTDIGGAVMQGRVIATLTKREASAVDYLVSIQSGIYSLVDGEPGTEEISLGVEPDFTFDVTVQADGPRERRDLINKQVVVDCEPGDLPANFTALAWLGINDATTGEGIERPVTPVWIFEVSGPCLDGPLDVRIPDRGDSWYAKVALPHVDESGALCSYVATAAEEPDWFVPNPTVTLTALPTSALYPGQVPSIERSGRPGAYATLPKDFTTVLYTQTYNFFGAYPTVIPATLRAEVTSPCLDAPRSVAVDTSETVNGYELDPYFAGDFIYFGGLVTLTDLPVISSDRAACEYELELVAIERDGVVRDPADFAIEPQGPFTILNDTGRAFRVVPIAPEPTVTVDAYCAGSPIPSGRIDVHITNNADDMIAVELTVGSLVPRNRAIAPGITHTIFVTGRPDGELSVAVRIDGAVVHESVQLVDCTPETPVVSSACLLGNGRIDVTLANRSDVAVAYLVTIGRLAPRSSVVPAGGTDRISATGRADGVNAVFIRRNGFPFWSTPTVVNCDAPVPARVTWSCLAEQARIDAMLFNGSDASVTFDVTVGTTATRTIEVAGGALHVESVSGRRDGPHLVTVFQAGVQVHKRTEQVACATP